MWNRPGMAGHFISEGRAVENTTATLFFCVFIVSLIQLCRGVEKRSFYFLLAGLGLFGFLEEIKYGIGWFNPFDAPVIYGVTFDGVHKIFAVAVGVIGHEFAIAGYIALALVLVPLTFFVLKRISVPANRILQVAKARSEYWFLLVFALLMLAVLILNLGLIYHLALRVLEEMLEFHAALALLFCCLTLELERRREKVAS